MSKIAILTDTHFGARQDSQLFMDYFDKFYGDVFFPFLEKSGIKQVFHLGDLVDRRKYISFYTLRRMKEILFDPMSANGIKLSLLVGNHDATYRNTNDVNAPDQLLYGYENVDIYDKPTEIEMFGEKVALLPWVPSEDVADARTFIDSTEAKLLFGHLELNNFEVLRGVKMESGMDPKLLSKFRAVLTGHYHTKQDDGRIFYLGSPYEITFSDMGDVKGFHTYDFETKELEFIANPYKMFHRVYYDDKGKKYDSVVKQDFAHLEGGYVKVVVINRTNQYFFEKFMDRVYFANPVDVKVVDDFNISSDAELDTSDIMSMAEDTLTILNGYVDSLELDADKEKLKSVLRSLYTEAQHVEF